MGPEKTIENKIKRALEKSGAYFIKNYGGAHAPKGRPDLMACTHGRFIAIEVKKPVGGVPTPVQLRHLKRIAACGGLACLACSPHVVTIVENGGAAADDSEYDEVTLPSEEEITVDFATDVWQRRRSGVTVLRIAG